MRICDTLPMNSVMILYPKTEDSTFDIDYYVSTHMPLYASAVGDACHGWGVSTAHGDKYHAVSWMMVESMDALAARMKEHGGPVMADIKNFTNVRAEMITGDVVV
jgi:uncharacterized protein (TIGR02118 family)